MTGLLAILRENTISPRYVRVFCIFYKIHYTYGSFYSNKNKMVEKGTIKDHGHLKPEEI